MAEVKRYLARSPMPVSARALFDWHARDGTFQRLNPPFENVELLERSGGLQPGARTVLRVHVGPLARRWVAVHTALEDGRSFTDQQISGPFARWEHTHRMLPDGEQRSTLEDDVTYAMPFGRLGRAGAVVAQAKLEAVFAYRHALMAADLARHSELPGAGLRVGITGSHGHIGSALASFLTTGGHSVVRLGRSILPDNVEGLDAVVNLAGAGIADRRWTESRKEEIRASRIRTTESVAQAILGARRPPPVWISGSAIGFYGNRGELPVDESSPRGTGFLADLTEAWEAATRPVELAGIRVVHLRTGVVLSPDGGALGKMMLPFQLGAGGRLGSGRQVYSWISLEDALGAIHFALLTATLRGPVNLTAPEPVTNATFTHVLGRVLRRPTLASIPAPVIHTVFGQMGAEALLGGANVVPRALLDAGFRFRWPGLEEALRFCLGKDRLPSAA
jgi:uncharacterized protein (TIGR01777 family)